MDEQRGRAMNILSTSVVDRTAWKAADHVQDRSWLFELGTAELEEIDAAVAVVRQRRLEPPNFDRDDFPLPTFGRRLSNFADELENGRGFFLLRGIPVDRYDLQTVKTIYWGIGTHLGCPVFQNTKGELISHVADRGDDYGDVNTRLYTTAAAANPHNDPSDVVGLLCVRKSPQGGASMIASATSIYNEILANHHEHLEILYRGFPHDLRGEGTTRLPNETTPPIPVYSYFAGKLSCCLNSKSSKTAREKAGHPLTSAEAAALACVEDLVSRSDLCLTMDFRPGDIQFLNNYAVLHTRTAFQDGREPDQRRLLLRLWLNLRDGRQLAPGFGDRFNNGSRGGVPASRSSAAA